MEPEEFEKEYDKDKDKDEFPEDRDSDSGGEELLMQQDIIDGITLLNKVKRLLNYVGDVELCKTVTKREREAMARVSIQVADYLDNVAPNYEVEE